MARRLIQNLLFLLPLAVWTGAAVGLTFLTTPVIFAALDRDAASRLVGQLFPGYFRLGLLCLALALAAAVAGRLAGPGRPLGRWATPALLAAALAVLLYAGLALEPQIAAVQARIPSFLTDLDSPARQEFRRLHSLSSILNLGVLLLTAAVWVVTALGEDSGFRIQDSGRTGGRAGHAPVQPPPGHPPHPSRPIEPLNPES